jgi:hypothetical protein
MLSKEGTESRDFIVNYRLNGDDGPLGEEGVKSTAPQAVKFVRVGFKDGTWRTTARREPGISKASNITLISIYFGVVRPGEGDHTYPASLLHLHIIHHNTLGR